MAKSWTSKQWMLALAVSCGLLGLVVVLSGVPGPGESSPPAASHGPSPAGRDASGPTGSRGEPAQVAPGAGEGGARSDRAHASGTPSGLKWAGLPDVGGEAGGHRLGQLTPRALHRYERMRRKKGPESLRAGAERGHSGTPGGGLGGGAGNTPVGTTDSAITARAPVDSDIAFTSESGIQFATDSQVEVGDIGKITGPAGTMSFWLQPEWEVGNQDDATMLQLGDGRVQVVKNANYLRFEFTDDGGVASGIGWPITDWKQGEWHQVTAIWNGSEYGLYIDGQFVTQMSHSGFVDLPSGTKLYVGSNYPEGRPVAPGTIGQVDLHNRPLTPGEVADQFLSGQ